MPKPPETVEAKARNIETDKSILARPARSTQDLEARSPQQLSFFTSLVEPAATVSIPPCPSCGATQGRQTAGVGPHFAGLRCVNCDRFIKWLPRPETELSSDAGGQQ